MDAWGFKGEEGRITIVDRDKFDEVQLSCAWLADACEGWVRQ
jgi:hypothetical protein